MDVVRQGREIMMKQYENEFDPQLISFIDTLLQSSQISSLKITFI